MQKTTINAEDKTVDRACRIARLADHIRRDLPADRKDEAVRIGRIWFASAGATRRQAAKR